MEFKQARKPTKQSKKLFQYMQKTHERLQKEKTNSCDQPNRKADNPPDIRKIEVINGK